MKEITNVLKSKQFLIGLGVGFAGYWAYNKYMKKEAVSNIGGVIGSRKSTRYGNSACGKDGKIAIACGQSCPDGWIKVGGSHQAC